MNVSTTSCKTISGVLNSDLVETSLGLLLQHYNESISLLLLLLLLFLLDGCHNSLTKRTGIHSLVFMLYIPLCTAHVFIVMYTSLTHEY